MDLLVPLVKQIPTVSTYYDAYLDDPTGATGFLKAEVSRLTQPGSSDADQAEAKAIQGVLAGLPRDQVLAPLQTAKDQLNAVESRAVALKSHLLGANQQLNQAFQNALSDAEKALN